MSEETQDTDWIEEIREWMDRDRNNFDTLVGHLRRLLDRVEQLEQALGPFADHARWMEGCNPTELWDEAVDEERTPKYHDLIVDDYFHARRVLNRKETTDE